MPTGGTTHLFKSAGSTVDVFRMSETMGSLAPNGPLNGAANEEKKHECGVHYFFETG